MYSAFVRAKGAAAYANSAEEPPLKVKQCHIVTCQMLILASLFLLLLLLLLLLLSFFY